MGRAAGIVVAIQTALIVVLAWLWLNNRTEGVRLNQPVATPASPASQEAGNVVARSVDSRGTMRASDESTAEVGTSSPPTLYTENTIAWSADDPIGIIVHGHVVDESGNEIEDARIEFTDDVGKTRSADGGRLGGFVVHGLHPGVWSVEITAAVFARFEGEITLPPSGTRFRYDAVLGRSTIVFVKFDSVDGRPFYKALRELVPDPWLVRLTAVATEQKPPSRLGANRNGVRCLGTLGEDYSGLRQFGIAVPEGCDGIINLDSVPPFYVSAVFQNVVIQTKEVRASHELVNFTIDVSAVKDMLATVRFRIVDAESRKPIPDADAEVGPSNAHGRGETSPPDGKMVFEHRLPGLLVLRIEAAGHEHFEQYLRLAPGQVADLGDVAIDPSTTIKGRLLGSDDRPVAGNVRCIRLDRYASAQPWERSFFGAEVDGGFEIDEIGRGRYLLIGWDETHSYAATPKIVDTSAGNVIGLDLKLARGVTVMVDLDFGAPAVVAEIRDASGTPLHSDSSWGRGSFSIVLAPGTYALTIFDEERPLKTQPVIVGSSPLRVRVAE